MNIAVFYPSVETAWSITNGVSEAFKRMGHVVLDNTTDTSIPLADQDLIFVCGPEHLWQKLRTTYPMWDDLKMPKVGWLQETVEREDYELNPIAVGGHLPVEDLKRFTPYLFTPAIQDQKYDLIWLPFGVDTNVFYPRDKEPEAGILYSGSLYAKRRKFLEDFPEVREKARYQNFENVTAYATAIATTDTVLILPCLSDTSNARTFEVLASGTSLVTAALQYEDHIFTHNTHLLYYVGDPCFEMHRARGAGRDMAMRAYEEILKKHTIEHRLFTVFERIENLGKRARKFRRGR